MMMTFSSLMEGKESTRDKTKVINLKACYTLLTIMTFMAILASKMRKSSARKARVGMFGGGLLTLAVISSISLGFSTFLIGSGGCEVGPISVVVGDIAYADEISLNDISFQMDSDSFSAPNIVLGNNGEDVLIGDPIFSVDVSFSHAAMETLAYFDNLLLNIQCSLQLKNNNSSYCDFDYVSIGLRDYPTFYYDVSLRNGFANGNHVATGYFGVKSHMRPSLSDLADMDMLYVSNVGNLTYVRLSFHVLETSGNYNVSVMKNGIFSVNFSLIAGNN